MLTEYRCIGGNVDTCSTHPRVIYFDTWRIFCNYRWFFVDYKFLGLVRFARNGRGLLISWGLLQVDPAMLQYQNQKLAQQLDHQRSEISALENKCSQFRSKQASYDDTLITVNRAWNQVCAAPSFLFQYCIRVVFFDDRTSSVRVLPVRLS